MSEKTIPNPTFTAILFGLAGGIVGALVMGLLAYAIPAPNTGGDPFFIAAAKIMGFGNLAWAFGWLLHVVTGMGVGAVFGILVSRVSFLRNRKIGYKIIAGILVGFFAWVVLFIPMMTLLMPTATSVGTLGSGFLVNVTFGLILGVVFVLGQSFYLVEPTVTSYMCKVCGNGFPSENELRDHQHDKHLKASEETAKSS